MSKRERKFLKRFTQLVVVITLTVLVIAIYQKFAYTTLYVDVANSCSYEGERIIEGTEVAPKVERILVSEHDAQDYLDHARRQGKCISENKNVY